jgi:hypothetical protein
MRHAGDPDRILIGHGASVGGHERQHRPDRRRFPTGTTMQTVTNFNPPAEPAPEPSHERALLAACGDVSDERVLIVGPDSLDAMCALIRRGARQVTAFRHADRLEAASADLVVAPHIVSAEDAAGVLAYARRALAPFGRIVLMLPTESADRMARRVAQMLPGHALSLVRARRVGAWTLIAAERPFAASVGHA